MSQVNSEIQALEKLVGYGVRKSIVVNGVTHDLVIRQVKTGKIPKLLKASGSLLPTLTDKSVKLDMLSLVLFHTSECLDMLCVLVDLDRAVVDELEVDQTVELLSECLEVNIDFFVQKVLPLLSGGLARLEDGIRDQKGRLKSLGQTPPSI